MNKLWAPWRIDYVRSPKEEGCVFCKKSQSTNHEKDLVLFKGKECFILMNLYPYSNGHIMISPYKHTSDTNDISDRCNNEIMFFSNETMNILRSTMNAEGFNFGANLGKAGGAGIEEHIHYHIVRLEILILCLLLAIQRSLLRAWLRPGIILNLNLIQY